MDLLFCISTLAFITLLFVTRFNVNTVFAVAVLSVQLFVLVTWTHLQKLEPFAEDAARGDVLVNVSLVQRDVIDNARKFAKGVKNAVRKLLTSESAKKYYEYK
jgi:hypothetical protein